MKHFKNFKFRHLPLQNVVILYQDLEYACQEHLAAVDRQDDHQQPPGGQDSVARCSVGVPGTGSPELAEEGLVMDCAFFLQCP